jgi:hypothetical protein
VIQKFSVAIQKFPNAIQKFSVAIQNSSDAIRNLSDVIHNLLIHDSIIGHVSPSLFPLGALRTRIRPP